MSHSLPYVINLLGLGLDIVGVGFMFVDRRIIIEKSDMNKLIEDLKKMKMTAEEYWSYGLKKDIAYRKSTRTGFGLVCVGFILQAISTLMQGGYICS